MHALRKYQNVVDYPGNVPIRGLNSLNSIPNSIIPMQWTTFSWNNPTCLPLTIIWISDPEPMVPRPMRFLHVSGMSYSSIGREYSLYRLTLIPSVPEPLWSQSSTFRSGILKQIYGLTTTACQKRSTVLLPIKFRIVRCSSWYLTSEPAPSRHTSRKIPTENIPVTGNTVVDAV